MIEKKLLSKTIALILGVTAFFSLIASFAFVWTPPSDTPSQGNVLAHINVGPDYQYKVGDFCIGGGTGQLGYKLSNVGGTLKLVGG